MRGELLYVAAATAREAFTAALFNGPLLPCDAMAVLSGDGDVRLKAAVGALRQRVADKVILMGGLDNPPHSLPAGDMRRFMLENGLAPSRVIEESAGQNTHEQAEVLAGLCVEHEWDRVMLITSPYHMPRAFLTVLASFRAISELVQIIPLPAACPWWECPEGLDTTRMDLLTDEFAKIERYGDHVASYADGLEYLRHWE